MIQFKAPFKIIRVLVLCAGTLLSVARGERPPSAPPPRLAPENTYAVIVGVLDWDEESLTSYAKENRQDVALYEQLRTMGVPANHMVLLLDEKATRRAITQSVAKVAAQAKPDSTLIIYYAGHGMKTQAGGVFACYDIQTRRLQRTGWVLSELEQQIRENFSGSQVLLFADCCFSGLLSVTTSKLNQAGIKAASLTSASSKNTSTNNWTYTISLIDLLKGQPLADRDNDDQISLLEAGYEVRDAMFHYEGQRNGFSLHGLSKDFILTSQRPESHAPDADQLNSHIPVKPGDYVSVQRRGRWKSVRVVDERPGELLLQRQQYSSRPTSWIPAKQIKIKRSSTLKPLLPPEPLSEKEARIKATVNGKYSKLLAKLKVESDFDQYGEFHSFGRWNGSSYAGHTDLPTGYWVYVYPHWYVWKNQE